MSNYKDLDFQPLIFIHIPKTAGTSFRVAANQIIGLEAIINDYDVNSQETSQIVKDTVYNPKKGKKFLVDEIVQNRIQFFSGHFHAAKYLDIFDNHVRWCTFLRDPIQRVISEYFHVVKYSNYDKSLEYFGNEPQNCNRQSQLISGIQLKEFYFVGITELYQDSLNVFNKATNLNFPYIQANKNPQKFKNQNQVDSRVLKIIEDNNIQDIAIYNKANKLLQERLNS